MREIYYWNSKTQKWELNKPQYVERKTVYFSVRKGEYNPALGSYIGSRRDQKDAINRIEQETGTKLVEVGNERPKIKPKKHDYSLNEREVHELNRILDGNSE